MPWPRDGTGPGAGASPGRSRCGRQRYGLEASATGGEQARRVGPDHAWHGGRWLDRDDRPELAVAPRRCRRTGPPGDGRDRAARRGRDRPELATADHDDARAGTSDPRGDRGGHDPSRREREELAIPAEQKRARRPGGEPRREDRLQLRLRYRDDREELAIAARSSGRAAAPARRERDGDEGRNREERTDPTRGRDPTRCPRGTRHQRRTHRRGSDREELPIAARCDHWPQPGPRQRRRHRRNLRSRQRHGDGEHVATARRQRCGCSSCAAPRNRRRRRQGGREELAPAERERDTGPCSGRLDPGRWHQLGDGQREECAAPSPGCSAWPRPGRLGERRDGRRRHRPGRDRREELAPPSDQETPPATQHGRTPVAGETPWSGCGHSSNSTEITNECDAGSALSRLMNASRSRCRRPR
jgi:hypothetical protein